MARRRNNSGNDEDFSIFNNSDSIDKQAKAWEKAGKDISDHIAEHFESRMNRIEANLRREFNTSSTNTENSSSGQQKEQSRQYESIIAQSLAQRDKHNEDYKRTHGQDFKDASLFEKAAANIINQSGKGQKFDPDVKIGQIIGKELLKGIERAFSTYLMKPLQQGMNNMYSAYEANMSEIAGRMGMERAETTSLMHSAIKELNSTAAKNAVSANKELIPELRAVAARGWQGNDAVRTAVTNSIDKKIMPWLDSSTEAWNNLQFNLDDNQMKLLKAQQLQLQETQSGNRLLQSGVINQLTSDIAPLLTNIDYNTMDKDNLSSDMQKLIKSGTERGLTPQEAYAQAKQILDIYKNPTAGFDKGDAFSVMTAQAAYTGGGIDEIVKAALDINEIAANTAQNAGIVGSAMGLTNATGITREEGYKQVSRMYQGYLDSDDTAVSTSLYDQTANRATEKVTATQEWDNRIENGLSGTALYLSNNWPHMQETLTNILQVVSGIATGIVSGMIGKHVLNKVAPKLLSQLGKTATTKAATSGLASAANSFVSNHTPALVSKMAASKGGTIITNATSKLPGVAQVAAPIVAGGLIGKYGISKGNEDIEKGHEVRGNISKVGGIAAGVGGAVAGVSAGAAMLGVGAANAWNPVGWGLLLMGGLTVAGTAVFRAMTATSGAAESLSKSFKNLDKTNAETVSSQKKSLSSLQLEMSKYEDATADSAEAQRFASELVQTGLVSEEAVRGKSVSELSSLTDTIIEGNKKLQKELGIENKKVANKLETEVAKETMDANKAVFDKAMELSGGGTLSLEEHGSDYTDVQTLMADYVSAIKDPKAQAKAQEMYNTMTSNDKLSKGELATFFDQDIPSGNWKSLWHTTIDRKRAPTRFDMDVNALTEATNAFVGENVYTDTQAATEIISLLETYEQDYLKAGKNKKQQEKVRENWKEYFQKLKKSDPDMYEFIKVSTEGIAEKLEIDPESYAVGTPYIAEDQIAQLHKGEAVIPADSNTARLRGLLGLNDSQISQQKASSSDVVNAIQAQTDTLKQVIEKVISALPQLQSTNAINMRTKKIRDDRSNLNPQYGNTRPVY